MANYNSYRPPYTETHPYRSISSNHTEGSSRNHVNNRCDNNSNSNASLITTITNLTPQWPTCSKPASSCLGRATFEPKAVFISVLCRPTCLFGMRIGQLIHHYLIFTSSFSFSSRLQLLYNTTFHQVKLILKLRNLLHSLQGLEFRFNSLPARLPCSSAPGPPETSPPGLTRDGQSPANYPRSSTTNRILAGPSPLICLSASGMNLDLMVYCTEGVPQVHQLATGSLASRPLSSSLSDSATDPWLVHVQE
ncbi:hypothetical protein HD806DRAFT_526710 [Xylariaceae sp. AK1471]|nr:hypothetical protein HD806DRAFT_526710 [Xylariaceae sp. AK1471]